MYLTDKERHAPFLRGREERDLDSGMEGERQRQMIDAWINQEREK